MSTAVVSKSKSEVVDSGDEEEFEFLGSCSILAEDSSVDESVSGTAAEHEQDLQEADDGGTVRGVGAGEEKASQADAISPEEEERQRMMDKLQENMANMKTVLLEQRRFADEAKARMEQKEADWQKQLEEKKASVEVVETENKELKERNEEAMRKIQLEHEREFAKLRNENNAVTAKLDELTAKLLHAEDYNKTYERIIEQFRSDGYVEVQQTGLFERQLTKELREKGESLETEKKRSKGLETNLAKQIEKSHQLEQELINLRAVSKLQFEEDRRYISEVRGDYERRLSTVQAEVDSLQRQVNSQPAAASGQRVWTCERCALRIPDERMYLRHTMDCRPTVDNID